MLKQMFRVSKQKMVSSKSKLAQPADTNYVSKSFFERTTSSIAHIVIVFCYVLK